MRTMLALVAALCLGVLSVSVATPASADATGVTFTVTCGTLAITAPSGLTYLHVPDEGQKAEPITIPLGTVQVSDMRCGAGAGAGWVASVISTEFLPPAGQGIPASEVSYAVGAIVSAGHVTHTTKDAANLTDVSPVLLATSTGPNSATWTPTISVTVPNGTAANVYTASITHSVA